MSKDLALFYGILAGDGCLSRSGGKYFISVCGNLKDDKIFHKNTILPLINRLRSKETKYKEFPKYNKIEFNFSDKTLFTRLSELGFPVGKKINKNLVLPKSLEPFVTQFIAGVMATDGSICFRSGKYRTPYPIISVKTKSKTLMDQLFRYLSHLGLNPKLREVKHKGFTCGEYEIAIYGHENVRKFQNLVGFINPKHEKKYLSNEELILT
jgi:hypothetical protein